MINFTPIHELFSIGPFHVYSWGLMFVIGFIVAGILLLFQARKKQVNQEYILNVLLFLLLGAIIGGRLFFVLEHIDYFLTKPLEIFAFGKGGETSYGGILLGLGFLWLYTKFSKRKDKLMYSELLDFIAPYVVLGAAIARIGCFLNWDDFGIQCFVPWCISIVGDIPRHPTQLYESLYLLFIFGVLLWFRKMRENPYSKQTCFKLLLEKKGSLFLIFIFIYSIFRFFNDFLRVYGYTYFGMPISQWMCIVLFLFSGIVLWKKKG